MGDTTPPPPEYVLVVDDDSYLRSAISRLLRDDGFTVVDAGNGQEALRYLRSEPIGAVVVDLGMPVMDGEEFLRRKQRDPSIAAVPTVVLTGEERNNLHRDIRSVVTVLRKPVEFERLVSALLRTSAR